jgi:glyoxylate/hydroxypyruvate reductase
VVGAVDGAVQWKPHIGNNAAMNVLYFSADADADVWVPALQEALDAGSQASSKASSQAGVPRAWHVAPWQPGASAADYAVVWKPPQQMLDEQPRLKAIFNVGAGVDAVMKLNLPVHVPIIRLDDAGMAVQMAEYVCHALIRHFRRLDGYEADARQGRWTQREKRSRADFPVGIMGLGVLGARVAQAVGQFDFPVVGWVIPPISTDLQSRTVMQSWPDAALG